MDGKHWKQIKTAACHANTPMPTLSAELQQLELLVMFDLPSFLLSVALIALLAV